MSVEASLRRPGIRARVRGPCPVEGLLSGLRARRTEPIDDIRPLVLAVSRIPYGRPPTRTTRDSGGDVAGFVFGPSPGTRGHARARPPRGRSSW
jgi:hypothetical protein